MKYSQLKDIEEIGVSHNPEIKKKTLIENGQVPHLTQLSRVVLKLGQAADRHAHQDMYEIFNVESGVGEIIIDGNKFSLTSGVCATVEPGEEHEVINSGKEDLIITMLGVEV